MRIPDYELHHRHIATYGAGGMELEAGVSEPGCPALYKARYVTKKEPFVAAWQPTYGLAVHEALYLIEEDGLTPDDALRRGFEKYPSLSADRFQEAVQDLTDLIERGGILTTMHTVAVEQHLTAPLYEDEDFGPIAYGGIIDHIGVQEDVDVNPVLWVTDYKTDRSPPSYTKLGRWRQGPGYAWLVRSHADRYLPGVDGVRVNGLYEAVKWYTLPIEYSNEDLDVWQEWAISIARAILRDDKGREKLNPRCTWCPIKADCKAWNQLPGDGETLLARLHEKPLIERVGALPDLKVLISRLKKEQEETEEALREAITAEGPLTIGEDQWLLKAAQRKDPRPRELHQIMGDDFYDVISVRIGDTEKWAKKHLERAPDVERAIPLVPKKSTLKQVKIETPENR